jgi:hypothetical protein
MFLSLVSAAFYLGRFERHYAGGQCLLQRYIERELRDRWWERVLAGPCMRVALSGFPMKGSLELAGQQIVRGDSA